MVITQAGLGLRVAELPALQVEDVDFLDRNVRVARQLAKGTRERVRPKTARSIRTMPLPTVLADTLADTLAAHLAAFPPGPMA